MKKYYLAWIKVNGVTYSGEDIEKYYYPTQEDPWFALYFKDGKFLTAVGNIEVMQKEGDT